jgi:hypothetical protein
MTSLLLLLVPVVIIDVANPVLFAAVMYTLGTRNPFGSSFAMLLG